LQLLNKKFNLNLSTPQLLNYALQLGSDCPFFIINSPCIATSRGEILESINIDLSAYQIILINPGIHINTGWAFAQLAPATPERPVAAIIAQPILTWKEELKNDFEKPVFEKYPEIKNIKAHLYDNGAVYAAMSGSGSTVYGIFEKGISLPQFSNTNYFVRAIREA
jgi:4-diphosphocytidyl-2-C-methyl-D-erythritol kinase